MLLTAKDMKKSIAVLTLCVILFALCGSVDAQQTGKVPRVGYLDGGTASGMATVLLNAFRHELSKLGWIEGKNIIIEYRFAEQKLDRLPKLAAELVGQKIDLIVVNSVASASAAKSATTSIPIVMAAGSDPVAAGLIASLARPGGNVTGLSGLASELNTKRLEILKESVPKLVRLGLLRQPGGSVGFDLQLKELRAAASALELKLEEIVTQADPKGLENGFQTAKQKQLGAIMTTATRRFEDERKRIAELAIKYRLPAIYPQKEFVETGGLMSYGTDLADLYRRAAHYVDKILKGTKPGYLPVQQATKFEFVINLKAANQIGLTIPPNVLVRADRVIK